MKFTVSSLLLISSGIMAVSSNAVPAESTFNKRQDVATSGRSSGSSSSGSSRSGSYGGSSRSGSYGDTGTGMVTATTNSLDLLDTDHHCTGVNASNTSTSTKTNSETAGTPTSSSEEDGTLT
ncbi:hypothetical protein BB560_005936 [Smittium megazygosporum]|uniref:Uncharacterized protein n=1 Tax=Smittium megazygosporum TaxID=133381 RepID=A0A2T9YQ35_9FUNG|nr:hypothetical protein BB560_005936 [Smittium megazygosporum]